MARAPYGLEIGTTLGGYRIERLLGRGGMGIVYLAEHAKLRRPAALKVLAPELADTPDFRARFIQESQLAASIDHPSVIPIYDAGEVGDVLYIAMRYVKGSDLRAVLRAGPLPPSRAVAVLDQVAGGLHAAHCEGLVHRDVKPANILVEDDTARIYVSDFGVARRTAGGGLTRTGSLVGTIDYCSPEQIEGKRLDGRADVYSLGCVLFHCLTGLPPFPNESDFAVLNAHLSQEPPRVSRHTSNVSPALDSVIATALAKRPDDRYSTTVEFAAACRRAVPTWTEGESTAAEGLDRPTPVVAAPPSPPHAARTRPDTVPRPVTEAVRPPRRRRRKVALFAAAALLLGAGAAGALAMSLGGGKKPGRAGPGHGVKTLIATRLQQKLVPLQQALTDRVRNASSTASSITGIETAAANVRAEVGRTQGWASANLHPRTVADRALTSALGSALSAHEAYASYLADLAPATSITSAQATTAVARSRAAEDAYTRLTGAGLNRPAMPLSGTDTERLVAVARQQTTSHPPPPPPTAFYDTVANSNGTGIRYRYTPNHWCGYSPDGSPVPKTDPCWNDVVPGAGAAEGEQLRVYCYTSGAVVKGSTLWAKVRENPDEYVPATYLLAAHNGPVSGVPSC